MGTTTHQPWVSHGTRDTRGPPLAPSGSTPSESEEETSSRGPSDSRLATTPGALSTSPERPESSASPTTRPTTNSSEQTPSSRAPSSRSTLPPSDSGTRPTTDSQSPASVLPPKKASLPSPQNSPTTSSVILRAERPPPRSIPCSNPNSRLVVSTPLSPPGQASPAELMATSSKERSSNSTSDD